MAITGSAIGFGLYERSHAQREQLLRDEATTQKERATTAAQELVTAGKELALLNDQVRDFQAATTNLVTRKDQLERSIDMMNRAVNEFETSTTERRHFREMLAKRQDELVPARGFDRLKRG